MTWTSSFFRAPSLLTARRASVIPGLLVVLATGCNGSAPATGTAPDAGQGPPLDASTGGGTGGGAGGGGAGGGLVTDAGPGTDGGVGVLPSPGCGLQGAPTGHLAGQKSNVDGIDRSYDLFVPTPYKPAKPHAVIFSYHGVGGTANTNHLRLDENSTAHDGFSINVAPQGWTSPEWDQKHFVPYNLDASLTLFDQVLDHLAANYCIDLNRVFVMGHSNGGQMAFHAGCLRSDRIRAIFPLSGRCFSYGQGVCDPNNDPAVKQCNGSVMVMSVMGLDDVTRLADEAATVEGFRLRQGCSTDTVPTDPAPCLRFQGCHPGAEVSSCRIPGLGHSVWSEGLDGLYEVMMSL